MAGESPKMVEGGAEVVRTATGMLDVFALVA